MILNEQLVKNGLSDSQIAFVASGFLQLFEDQLSYSIEKTRLTESVLDAGNREAALKILSGISRTMECAEFSRKALLELLKR